MPDYGEELKQLQAEGEMSLDLLIASLPPELLERATPSDKEEEEGVGSDGDGGEVCEGGGGEGEGEGEGGEEGGKGQGGGEDKFEAVSMELSPINNNQPSEPSQGHSETTEETVYVICVCVCVCVSVCVCAFYYILCTSAYVRTYRFAL